MSDCSSVDLLVTPYVDGELAAADRQAVEQHMHACPPCRSRIAVEQAVRDVLHAQKPALHCERASDALRVKCAKLKIGAAPDQSRAGLTALPHTRSAGWRTRLAPWALAALVLLMVGGAFLYRLTDSSNQVMAAELTADHVKCFLLSGLVGGDQSAAAVEQMLASKFGWAARLPERPERAGLELVGERTCLYGHGRVAHIMYRHEGRPVSVFMLPKHARRAEVLGTLGHGAAIWSVGDRTFVLVAREPRADIERMASFVRAELH